MYNIKNVRTFAVEMVKTLYDDDETIHSGHACGLCAAGVHQ